MREDERQIKPVYDLIETSEWGVAWILKHPEKNSTESTRFAREIKSLIDNGENINWAPNWTDRMPLVGKDHPIKVGGTLLEHCVNARARELKKAGFTDVEVSRRHSESAGEMLKTFPSRK